MKLSLAFAAAFTLLLSSFPATAKPFSPFGSIEAGQFRSNVKYKRITGKKSFAQKSGKGKNAKAKGGRNLAQIRDAAINSTVAGLSPLRNYSTNYGALVADVKSYWRRSVANPSASALAGTILRHVKPAYRKYAARKVYAGAAEGVASVKLALSRS